MIELKDVYSGYGQEDVLQGFSGRIAPGDFCAILGPNGAGKSTLLYTLIGYLKPRRGGVIISGKALETCKPAWIARQLAFVPQEQRSEFDHTVLETLLMGRYPYLGLLQSYSAEDMEVVDAAMHKLQLDGFKHRWLSKLSGGEKQRVFIARALVQNTPCIILDESLSQLDINYQLEIMGLLREIHRQEGKTVLLVSHNLNLASNYADSLLFVKSGRLLAHGSPEELMQTEILHELFGLRLQVISNPHSGRPNIVYP